ncbi:UNVERIFIED_ORG: hypothetical protein M2348_000092 [Sphingomonas sp. R1F5B]
MTYMDYIWAFVAAGGGGAVIAFGIVRAFGEKWLDSKFTGRLQDLRHEHERQMESVRLETSRSLDRSTRLSEREFEVSAEAWSLIFEAYVRTMGALPGLRHQDDFSKLSDELARLVAKKNGFEDWETEELMARPVQDRNSYFSERKRAHELRDAKVAVREASNYLSRKALFIEKGVHDQLDQFIHSAWKALVAREIIMEIGAHDAEGIQRDDEDFRKGADAKVKDLEQLVRSCFWGSPEPSPTQT